MADVERGLGRAFGELAHFVGHHGKAATGFARASCFDGCVECKQVGLIGDLADHVRDARDLGRLLAEQLYPRGRGLDGVGQRSDGMDRLFGERCTALGRLAHRRRRSVRRRGMFGDLGDRNRDFLDAGGRGLGCVRLLACGLVDDDDARTNLARHVRDAPSGIFHALNGRLHRGDEAIGLA